MILYDTSVIVRIVSLNNVPPNNAGMTPPIFETLLEEPPNVLTDPSPRFANAHECRHFPAQGYVPPPPYPHPTQTLADTVGPV